MGLETNARLEETNLFSRVTTLSIIAQNPVKVSPIRQACKLRVSPSGRSVLFLFINISDIKVDVAKGWHWELTEG